MNVRALHALPLLCWSGPLFERAASRGLLLLPRRALAVQLRPIPHSRAPGYGASLPKLRRDRR